MPEPRTVSPAELKSMLDSGKVDFIFDLREADAFKGWKIEGRTPVETLSLPQSDFVGEEEKHASRFPRDRNILTVCAHGDAAKYAADMLAGMGFSAMSLEGGMDLWSEHYESRIASTSPEIHQIYRTAKGCISHVIISGHEALAIDAVRHTEHITRILESSGARLMHVIDTHLQADHISGGREIAEKYGARYWINPVDAKGAGFTHEPLTDGTVIKVGTSELQAVHSPGHTPGSTSLMLDGRFLFTGDTIMKGSIGRPDLGGRSDEWAALLFDTLFKKFSPLADEITILPTHAMGIREQDTDGLVRLTLGNARKNSDLYQIKDLKRFQQYVAESLPENPPRYQEIRMVNLGVSNPDEKKRKELEIGKNLCGMSKEEK